MLVHLQSIFGSVESTCLSPSLGFFFCLLLYACFVQSSVLGFLVIICYMKNQSVVESVAEYVAELKCLAANCDSNDHLEEAL